jgi:hypothetical protein
MSQGHNKDSPVLPGTTCSIFLQLCPCCIDYLHNWVINVSIGVSLFQNFQSHLSQFIHKLHGQPHSVLCYSLMKLQQGVQICHHLYTFECCILLRIYLTGSLWRRQSQQSFNTLTPFNFFFTHYMFRPLQAILRWDIQLVIWRTILIQRICCMYAIWYRDVITCSPNTCYQIKYKK